VTTCWECDVETDRPVTVRLEASTGRVGPFALCPQCFRTHYLPLMADKTPRPVPRRAPSGHELEPGDAPLLL